MYVPACECKFVLMWEYVRILMDAHGRADTLWMITRADCVTKYQYLVSKCCVCVARMLLGMQDNTRKNNECRERREDLNMVAAIW